MKRTKRTAADGQPVRQCIQNGQTGHPPLRGVRCVLKHQFWKKEGLAMSEEENTRTYVPAQPGYRWIFVSADTVEDATGWRHDWQTHGIEYVSDPIIGWYIEFVPRQHAYGSDAHTAIPVVPEVSGGVRDDALGGIICPHGFIDTYQKKFTNAAEYFDEIEKRAVEKEARRD